MIGDPEENERKHGSNSLNIVVALNIGFLIFYSVAIFWSFRGYREFKGVVEDNIGYDALKQQEEQNIIAYGILKDKHSPPTSQQQDPF